MNKKVSVVVLCLLAAAAAGLAIGTGNGRDAVGLLIAFFLIVLAVRR